MNAIIVKGAPTRSTPGILGQEYFDKDTKDRYVCVNVIHKTGKLTGDYDGEYEWVPSSYASSWIVETEMASGE